LRRESIQAGGRSGLTLTEPGIFNVHADPGWVPPADRRSRHRRDSRAGHASTPRPTDLPPVADVRPGQGRGPSAATISVIGAAVVALSVGAHAISRRGRRNGEASARKRRAW